MENESYALVEPDVEIVVRSGEHELAVIGLFQNKSDVWDILVGVDDTGRLDQLITLFDFVRAALPAATFGEVRASGVQ